MGSALHTESAVKAKGFQSTALRTQWDLMGRAGPGFREMLGFRAFLKVLRLVPIPQRPKLALLAGPRPLPYVGHVGRNVVLSPWIEVVLCPRDGRAQALVLQPGRESRDLICCLAHGSIVGPLEPLGHPLGLTESRGLLSESAGPCSSSPSRSALISTVQVVAGVGHRRRNHRWLVGVPLEEPKVKTPPILLVKPGPEFGVGLGG